MIFLLLGASDTLQATVSPVGFADSTRLRGMLEIAEQAIRYQNQLATFGIAVIVGVSLLIVAVFSIAGYINVRKQVMEARAGLSDFVGEKKAELTAAANISEHRLAYVEAEAARLFAGSATDAKNWPTACVWWAIAIERYGKVGDESLQRLAVDFLDSCLTETVKQGSRFDEQRERRSVEKALDHIPNNLSTEKQRIRENYDKVKGKAP